MCFPLLFPDLTSLLLLLLFNQTNLLISCPAPCPTGGLCPSGSRTLSQEEEGCVPALEGGLTPGRGYCSLPQPHTLKVQALFILDSCLATSLELEVKGDAIQQNQKNVNFCYQAELTDDSLVSLDLHVFISERRREACAGCSCLPVSVPCPPQSQRS